MHISKSAGYAIHGLGYIITRNSDGPVQISEIAAKHQVSKTYLAKIFQQLAAARIVIGQRGAAGGYTLARLPKDITLLEIVEAVDGPIIKRHCCLGIDDCPVQKKCPVLDIFLESSKRLGDYLRSITLEDALRRYRDLKAPWLFQSLSGQQ
jgi:Rrf2 family protein